MLASICTYARGAHAIPQSACSICWFVVRPNLLCAYIEPKQFSYLFFLHDLRISSIHVQKRRRIDDVIVCYYLCCSLNFLFFFSRHRVDEIMHLVKWENRRTGILLMTTHVQAFFLQGLAHSLKHVKKQKII